MREILESSNCGVRGWQGFIWCDGAELASQSPRSNFSGLVTCWSEKNNRSLIKQQWEHAQKRLVLFCSCLHLRLARSGHLRGASAVGLGWGHLPGCVPHGTAGRCCSSHLLYSGHSSHPAACGSSRNGQAGLETPGPTVVYGYASCLGDGPCCLCVAGHLLWGADPLLLVARVWPMCVTLPKIFLSKYIRLHSVIL